MKRLRDLVSLTRFSKKTNRLFEPAVWRRMLSAEKRARGEHNPGAHPGYLGLGRSVVRADYLRRFADGYAPTRDGSAPWVVSDYGKAKNALIRAGIKLLARAGGPVRRAFTISGLNALSAEVVLIMRSVRLFYLEAGLTAKVAKTGRERKVAREIEFRTEVLQQQNLLNTPPIVAHGSGHDWFLERMLTGRVATAADAPRLLSELSPMLAKHYEHNLGEHPPAETYWGSTEAPELEPLRGKRLVYALGHGDLRLYNIFVEPDGAFTIIDWDSAELRPVALDVLRLASLTPELTAFWNAWLERQTGGKPTVTIEEMRLIATACR